MATPTPPVVPHQGRRRASGALEGEVLAALQRAGAPLTPREVQATLSGELTYSTVVTILSRLHGKEVLTRTPRGRAYAYAPLTDEAGLAARRMHKVLDGRADREVVLTRFADGLNDEDAALLRRLLTGAVPGPW
ncbi:BlaI/MecI/CopY family transcriptional regulator [Streptomyces triculaminicus]|uniref:BlaI/MecI/CopY family transcriptional regulator n=2 Tax=Streptomyces TaxID=1883 RepID=A0A939FT93_9ACTN|nr:MULTISPECIES: BlaI/MecI/CopY family transcriptional regulator [Streptomyces]MBO0655600.1 BlaI/MecI/CopY family transcriptional regulator [Streptomyces triculaminicus]QSY50574.1 BlaI/MecI/CopY family transcriptional regulator [Streptomyces griseocarneus]